MIKFVENIDEKTGEVFLTVLKFEVKCGEIRFSPKGFVFIPSMMKVPLGVTNLEDIIRKLKEKNS